MNSLEKFRKTISEIDLDIVKLISRRAEVTLEIAKQKRKESSPLYHPNREQEIFLSLDRNNRGPLESAHLHNIYREIMSSTLSIEGKLKIAYFGSKGSFTHQAALKKFGHALELTPHSDVDSVFQDVQKNNASHGVLPIENSIVGKVTHTLDSLLDYNLHICSEVHLSVHHCLLGSTHNLKKIKKVYTHPQAKMQCQKWLYKNLPQAEWLESSSTSRAAEVISQKKDKSLAAIASSASATVYNLELIRENIEDIARNFTRFIIVSKEPVKPSKKNRTSIVISLPHKHGSLHQILDIISKAEVNLTSIESRPNRHEAWNYIFYIDFDGHEKLEPIPALFEEIKRKVAFFRNLGSYPIDVTHH